jgi:hypothetical protein
LDFSWTSGEISTTAAEGREYPANLVESVERATFYLERIKQQAEDLNRHSELPD